VALHVPSMVFARRRRPWPPRARRSARRARRVGVRVVAATITRPSRPGSRTCAAPRRAARGLILSRPPPIRSNPPCCDRARESRRRARGTVRSSRPSAAEETVEARTRVHGAEGVVQATTTLCPPGPVRRSGPRRHERRARGGPAPAASSSAGRRTCAETLPDGLDVAAADVARPAQAGGRAPHRASGQVGPVGKPHSLEPRHLAHGPLFAAARSSRERARPAGL